MPDKRAERAIDTMARIDVNRRVAWAFYYQAKQDRERLLALNQTLLRRLALLVVLVSEAEGLEGESEVVRVALGILGSLQRTARGAQAVAFVQEEREAKAS